MGDAEKKKEAGADRTGNQYAVAGQHQPLDA
jgi:hypothetical protein